MASLKEIYELLVREGINVDPRHPKQIQDKLNRSRQEFRRAKKIYKKFFDKERLTNPYADTRILNGALNQHVKRLLVGIDMEVAEVLLAQRLSENGQTIDLVLAHHPEGLALASLDDVMDMQTDMLVNLGFIPEVAKELMESRVAEVTRRLHSTNHSRAVDAAKLIGMSLMCCHTPADNHVVHYLENLVTRQKPKKLKNLVELLLAEPEYQEAMKLNAGPRILVGKPDDLVGKMLVDMTGGTEGSKNIYARLSQLGFNTQLSMHLSEDHYTRIKSEHIRVVNAGHMASDNLGMNLLLDKLEKKFKVEILECSGFRRVKRL